MPDVKIVKLAALLGKVHNGNTVTLSISPLQRRDTTEHRPAFCASHTLSGPRRQVADTTRIHPRLRLAVPRYHPKRYVNHPFHYSDLGSAHCSLAVSWPPRPTTLVLRTTSAQSCDGTAHIRGGLAVPARPACPRLAPLVPCPIFSRPALCVRRPASPGSQSTSTTEHHSYLPS